MGPLPRLIRCAVGLLCSSKINLIKVNLCYMLLQTNDHPMTVELERRTQPPGTVAVIKSFN